MTPLSSQQLLDGPLSRELILLGGKDGVGKSSAIVSLCWYVEQTTNATVHVIDTENKFRSALRSFGTDAPKNIMYYKCGNMNDVTKAVADVMRVAKPSDWLAVESMGPIWDMAQDLAYQAIAGVTKAEYLDSKRKGSGPIPQPDDFWKIAKGAYDGAFLDVIRQSETLNVVLSSVAKPAKGDSGFIKENKDRKAFRVEVGMDANLSGSPTMPSVVETLCLLELTGGNVTCRVLRDNLSVRENSRIEIEIPSRRDWAPLFFSECRG